MTFRGGPGTKHQKLYITNLFFFFFLFFFVVVVVVVAVINVFVLGILESTACITTRQGANTQYDMNSDKQVMD